MAQDCVLTRNQAVFGKAKSFPSKCKQKIQDGGHENKDTFPIYFLNDFLLAQFTRIIEIRHFTYMSQEKGYCPPYPFIYKRGMDQPTTAPPPPPLWAKHGSWKVYDVQNTIPANIHLPFTLREPRTRNSLLVFCCTTQKLPYFQSGDYKQRKLFWIVALTGTDWWKIQFWWKNLYLELEIAYVYFVA